MNRNDYLCIFVNGNKCYFYISTLCILPIKIYIKVSDFKRTVTYEETHK